MIPANLLISWFRTYITIVIPCYYDYLDIVPTTPSCISAFRVLSTLLPSPRMFYLTLI